MVSPPSGCRFVIVSLRFSVASDRERSVKQARGRKVQQPGGRWSGWMVASGLLHALLLGGLVFLGGSATRPPAILRARLVTEVRAVSVSRPERRTPDAPVPSRTIPAPPARAKKASMPSAPTVNQDTAESSPAKPAPLPDAVRETSRPPVAPAGPAGGQWEEAASSAPAGRVGEGATRALLPRSGPHGSHVEATSPAADLEPAPAPGQLEAVARGIFLAPGGGGGGTGRSRAGAADQGVGTSRAGTSRAGTGGDGTGGSGRGGHGGSGQPGDGGAGLASRSGAGGAGGGGGLADLLRSIRRQIEQAKIYPDAARREGIQGTVELRFRIASDGSVEAVEILRSSGSPVLDDASQQTIRRAAPYPVVGGWLRLPLSYRLDR